MRTAFSNTWPVCLALMLGLPAGSCVGDPPSPEAPAETAPAQADEAPPETISPLPTGVPVLLIGLDAADWQIARPLAEAGKLPRLRDLLDRGASGILQSEEPMASPILWTTVATGREPLDHGVLDFVELDPRSGTVMPVSAAQRKVPAVWDVFGAGGLDATVIAWWASWPAYPLKGRLVSDRVAYSTFAWKAGEVESAALFYPSGMAPELDPLRATTADIGPVDLAALANVPAERFRRADERLRGGESPFSDPVNHLRHIVASTRTYHQIALSLLEAHQSALFAVYYQGIDEVKHLFAHCRAPALPSCPPEDAAAFGGTIDSFYALQDRLLGELLARIAPETVVVIASDHGFLTGGGRPRTGSPSTLGGRAVDWHSRNGILLLAGPAIQPGLLPPQRLRDVGPTVLRLAGLPLAETLDGAPIEEAVRPDFREAHPVVRVADYAPWSLTELATSPTGLAAADRAALEKLRALGYVGGFQGAAGPRGEEAVRATIRRLRNEAFLQEQSGDLHAAVRGMRRALDLSPDDLAVRLSLAGLYQRLGNPEGALRLYDEALDPACRQEPAALPRAARAYLDAGRGEDGVRKMSGLVERYPSVTAIHIALALLHRGLDRTGEAEAELRKALAIAPGSVEAMTDLLALLRAQGREAEAAPLLRAALQLDPDSGPHHHWLGRIEEGRGVLPPAAMHYARASAARPDLFEPLSDLARVTAKLGAARQATEMLRVARRDFPDDPRPAYQFGLLLEGGGDAAGALEAFRDAERLGMRAPDLFNRLGRESAREGNARAARDYFTKSLEMLPDQPAVREELQALPPAG